MINRYLLGCLTLSCWQSPVLSSWTVPEILLSSTPTSNTSTSLEDDIIESTYSSSSISTSPSTSLGPPMMSSTMSTAIPTITIRPLEVVSAPTDQDAFDRVGNMNEPMEEESYFDSSMLPTHTAYLGKTATLTCIVHAAKSDRSVSWIRGRDLRILTVGRYTYTSDLRFEALHTEASSEWTVRIRSVQLRDQGNYDCQITTKPIRTFTVFLKVVEPSVEILGAPDLFVNRASMINLTCIVHHAPFPPEAINWYHNNESIGYTSSRGGVSVVEERGETTSSFLLLQNAQTPDTGVFTCKPEGMEPAVVTLHVLDGEHPAAMQTTNSAPEVSHTAGLTCTSLIFIGSIYQLLL